MSLRPRKHTTTPLLITKRQHQIWTLRCLLLVLVMLTAVVNLEWEDTVRFETTSIDPSAILAEMRERSSSLSTLLDTSEPFDEISSDQNARAVTEQRAQLETLCRRADNNHYVQGLEAIFHPQESPIIPQNTSIQPCHRVFWDLGVNIGDTVYKFINAGFYHLPCPASFHLEKGYMVESYVSAIDPPIRSRWSARFGKWINAAHWEGIHDWADSRMREATHQTRPEDYCYFGVEVRSTCVTHHRLRRKRKRI